MIVSARAGREGADQAEQTGSEQTMLENAVAKSSLIEDRLKSSSSSRQYSLVILYPVVIHYSISYKET